MSFSWGDPFKDRNQLFGGFPVDSTPDPVGSRSSESPPSDGLPSYPILDSPALGSSALGSPILGSPILGSPILGSPILGSTSMSNRRYSSSFPPSSVGHFLGRSHSSSTPLDSRPLNRGLFDSSLWDRPRLGSTPLRGPSVRSIPLDEGLVNDPSEWMNATTAVNRIERQRTLFNNNNTIPNSAEKTRNSSNFYDHLNLSPPGINSKSVSKRLGPNYCTFCKTNGEVKSLYTGHTLKKFENNKTIVVCPVLRKLQCKICGASGDDAHTITHCPRSPLVVPVAKELKSRRY